MSLGSANSGPIQVLAQLPHSEDHFPSAAPHLISTTAEGQLEDILALEPVTEQGSPRNLHNTSNRFKTSGKEEQQSPEDDKIDDEVEEELEGDSSVFVDGATDISRLNQLGFGWGLITKEWDWEASGLWDLDEIGEDGGLQYKEDLLEKDELGSTDSSVLKEEDEAHEFSDERLGLGLLTRKEVESHVTVAQRETRASGEEFTTPWADDGREEEGMRERHGESSEEVEGSGSDVEQGNDKAAQGDGLVEVEVGGDKEMTWYFTWK